MLQLDQLWPFSSINCNLNCIRQFHALWMDLKVKHDHRSIWAVYPHAIVDGPNGDRQDGTGDGPATRVDHGTDTATDGNDAQPGHPAHAGGNDDHGNTDNRGGATLGSDGQATDATGNVNPGDGQAAHDDDRYFNNQTFFEKGFRDIRAWSSLLDKHKVDSQAQEAFYLFAQRDELSWEICNDLLGKLQHKRTGELDNPSSYVFKAVTTGRKRVLEQDMIDAQQDGWDDQPHGGWDDQHRGGWGGNRGNKRQKTTWDDRNQAGGNGGTWGDNRDRRGWGSNWTDPCKGGGKGDHR